MIMLGKHYSNIMLIHVNVLTTLINAINVPTC